jgi:hypothetical protein
MSDLSPAEQAAADAVTYLDDSELTDAEARAIVAAVRPVILREAEGITPTGYTSSDGTAAGWAAASVASSWMGHDPGDLAARVLTAVRPLVESEALTALADDAERIGRDAVTVAEIRARAEYAITHPRQAADEMGDDRG